MSRRVLAAACGMSVVALLLVSSYDRMWGDTYLNLYAGRWIAEHGVPHHDPFTIAGAGRSWINSQWLANVTYFRLWEVAGYAGVTRGSMAAVWVAYAMLAGFLAHRRERAVVVAGAPLLGFVVASQYVFPRAQNLALPVFVAICILLLVDERRLEHARRGTARSWTTMVGVVLLLVLWANLHGSAPVGAALVIAYATTRVLRRRDTYPWLIAIPGAALAMLATPYGTDVFTSHRAVTGNEALQRFTTEWASVLTLVGAVQLALPILAFIALIAIAHRRDVRIGREVLAIATILLAASMVEARYLVWFSVALVLLAADAARTPVAADTGPSSRLVSISVVLGCAAALIGTSWLLLNESDQLELMPVEAADAAFRLGESRGSDSVYLGDLDSSAVLLWRHPEVAGRVLFDPRLEVFGSDDLRAWYDFQYQRGDDPMRIARDADVLLASKRWRPELARELERREGTVVETSDGVAVLEPRDGD